MAGTGPNVHQVIDNEEALTARQQEIAKRRQLEASVATPDDALAKYREIEQETLKNILGRDDSLRERFSRAGKALIPGMVGGTPTHKGQIVEAIRLRGDELAKDPSSDINQQLKDFRPNALKRLKALSLSSLDKFKRAAMRTREALRVKNGVNFMRERWRKELGNLEEMTRSLRGLRGKTIKGHMPDFLSKEMRATKKAQKKTEELMIVATEAAVQVVEEERKVIDRHEQIMRERYANERRLEDKLRQMMADHLPSRLGELNDALVKAAQGDPDPLKKLKDAIVNEDESKTVSLKNLPEPMQKALELTFDQMVESLTSGKTGDEYARFKASEMVSTSSKELMGLGPKEILDALKAKPVGTRVEVSLKDCPSQTGKFTVLEKSGDEITLLPDKPTIEGDVIFVDFKRKAIVALDHDHPKSEKRDVPDPKHPGKTKKESVQRFVHTVFNLNPKEGVAIALAA